MKIDFSMEQLAILDKAIQQLPYYVAAPLIQHINVQIIEAQKQDRDSQASTAALVQKKFDEKVDERDMPSGATIPPDAFAGD